MFSHSSHHQLQQEENKIAQRNTSGSAKVFPSRNHPRSWQHHTNTNYILVYLVLHLYRLSVGHSLNMPLWPGLAVHHVHPSPPEDRHDATPHVRLVGRIVSYADQGHTMNDQESKGHHVEQPLRKDPTAALPTNHLSPWCTYPKKITPSAPLIFKRCYLARACCGLEPQNILKPTSHPKAFVHAAEGKAYIAWPSFPTFHQGLWRTSCFDLFDANFGTSPPDHPWPES